MCEGKSQKDDPRAAEVSRQRRDMLTEASQLAEEYRQGGSGASEDDEQRVLTHGRDDGDGAGKFEHRGLQLPSARGFAQRVSGRKHRWRVGSDLLAIEVGDRVPVNQQAIATQHNGCLNTVATADGIYKITDTCHGERCKDGEMDPTIAATIA
jgi:hypothetical protein